MITTCWPVGGVTTIPLPPVTGAVIGCGLAIEVDVWAPTIADGEISTTSNVARTTDGFMSVLMLTD